MYLANSVWRTMLVSSSRFKEAIKSEVYFLEIDAPSLLLPLWIVRFVVDESEGLNIYDKDFVYRPAKGQTRSGRCQQSSRTPRPTLGNKLGNTACQR